MNQGRGRTVIVTGGTFGIGQAMTVLLAERGWRVAACGLDAPQVAVLGMRLVAAVARLVHQLGEVALQRDARRARAVTVRRRRWRSLGLVGHGGAVRTWSRWGAAGRRERGRRRRVGQLGSVRTTPRISEAVKLHAARVVRSGARAVSAGVVSQPATASAQLLKSLARGTKDP